MPSSSSKELGSFRIKGTSKPDLSAEEIAQMQYEAMKNLQAIERASIGVAEADVSIRHNRPIMVLTLGDLHVGSEATDYDKLDEIVEMVLSHPDICVVLLGDEIEGLKDKYLDTNTARTPMDVRQQIDYFKTRFLDKLANEGRVLGMVWGYFGHPGWAQDSSTIDPWRSMVEGYDIPLIRNGGRLNISFQNGHTQSLQIFHGVPGKTANDPVFGLRNALIQQSRPQRPNGAVGGHYHRSGIAKEYQPTNVLTNSAPQAMVMLNSGTLKGTGEDVDRFGIKLGLPPSDPVGQALVVSPRKRGNGKYEKNYPVMSYDHGLLALAALQMWDSLESQGMTEEMKETIRAQVEEKPEVVFNSRRSRQVMSPHDESPSKASLDEDTYQRWHNELQPQYAKAHFDIHTQLPVAVDFISNVRTGSNSEGFRPLEYYMKDRFKENPHALMAFLRNIVDQDVAKDPRRKEILDKIIALGVQYPEQVLTIMHDRNLRRNEWKRSLGDDALFSPIAAGSYLSEGLGAPLIAHHSVLQFSVGPKDATAQLRPHYTMETLDALDQHTSHYRPTFGHGQIYKLYEETKPGMIVGGHTPTAGFSSRVDRSNPETDQPIFISPGWWAKTADSIGRGNARPGAMPGQSAILMPGQSKEDYMVFPTSNPEETKLMHEALLLWQGLQILGLTGSVQA